MDSAAATDEKISPDDIEGKLREIFDGARDEVSSAKSQLATILGLIAIVAVLLAFALGRRGGRRRTTVVEVRRM